MKQPSSLLSLALLTGIALLASSCNTQSSYPYEERASRKILQTKIFSMYSPNTDWTQMQAFAKSRASAYNGVTIVYFFSDADAAKSLKNLNNPFQIDSKFKDQYVAGFWYDPKTRTDVFLKYPLKKEKF